MTALQLVERPQPGGSFELDLVDRPPRPRTSQSSPEDLHAVSPGSDQLLHIATLALTANMRVAEVKLTHRSGRPANDGIHELEEEILQALQSGDLKEAQSLLRRVPNIYIDQITLESVKTRNRVACTRYGIVNLLGPAGTERSRLVPQLLSVFRRVLGFGN
jgi:hypothetical protein